jgi:hypothetical protein
MDLTPVAFGDSPFPAGKGVGGIGEFKKNAPILSGRWAAVDLSW